jgi:hypothetical protein
MPEERGMSDPGYMGRDERSVRENSRTNNDSRLVGKKEKIEKFYIGHVSHLNKN